MYFPSLQLKTTLRHGKPHFWERILLVEMSSLCLVARVILQASSIHLRKINEITGPMVRRDRVLIIGWKQQQSTQGLGGIIGTSGLISTIRSKCLRAKLGPTRSSRKLFLLLVTTSGSVSNTTRRSKTPTNLSGGVFLIARITCSPILPFLQYSCSRNTTYLH